MARTGTMDRKELVRLARLGAEERLRALTTEMALIYRHFPELRRSGGQPMAGSTRQRRRRRMSAAERKAVGERMRKYWAARRKTRKATA